VRGRQTEAKALIDVAAPEDQPEIGCVRMRPIADASAETLLPFVQNSVEAWQPCSHRRLAGLHTSGRQRLRSPSHAPEGKEGDALGTDAGSPPRDFPPEAVSCWGWTKERSVWSTWSTTWTNSPTALIGGNHIAGTSSSFGFSSKPL
jgi:hypothetical protein